MSKNQEYQDRSAKAIQELRRGILVLATLSQLKEAKYGYALISSLAERGLDIEQGTLYPLLRRLESQGLLQSEWNVEGSRPRRFYVIGSMGKEMLEILTAEWRDLTAVVEKLLDDPTANGASEQGENHDTN